MRFTRTTLIVAAATAVTLLAAGCAPPSKEVPDEPAMSVPDKPSAPVTLNILDGGGKIAVEQMIDAFIKEHPDVISSVTWESASEGDIVSALKPQVDTGNIKTDLVITGTSGLAAGMKNNIWAPIATDYADRLSNIDNLIEPAQELQALTEGYGVNVVWCYCGPILTYNPKVVTELPHSAQEVLEWAKANPGKFGYSRPANSGVGRTFLLALPYILGDKDPNDPVNGWEKTWTYLEELGKYIENYPTSTGQSMTNLADGTWTLMPSSAGWDVGPRARGQVPEYMETYPMDNTTWMMDPNYALVTRGASADKMSAMLMLIQYMLKPEINAMTANGGQYVPGPVVEGATLDMAPQATQDLLNKFNRDWYAEATASAKFVAPPTQEVVVKALDIWDRRIGAGN
ncbi:extracellular solute-binding protein [Parafrigoribacterium mesophilum]|uniref:extracellular solute-binding protein n=1 Tax=Parafrigoribacterium mesophilum TaxID=433646 RepID=UPI0031FCCFFB